MNFPAMSESGDMFKKIYKMGPEPDPCGTPNFKGCFSKVPASTET